MVILGKRSIWEKLAESPPKYLPTRSRQPRVVQPAGASFGGTPRKAGHCVALESKRLSSSKGQTRRKAATQSHGPSAGWTDRESGGRWLPGCRRDGQAMSPSVPGPMLPRGESAGVCTIQGPALRLCGDLPVFLSRLRLGRIAKPQAALSLPCRKAALA